MDAPGKPHRGDPLCDVVRRDPGAEMHTPIFDHHAIRLGRSVCSHVDRMARRIEKTKRGRIESSRLVAAGGEREARRSP